MNRIYLSVAVISLVAARCGQDANMSHTLPITPFSSSTPIATLTTNFDEPITNALNRVTKKPFGIYITKINSPVQPEKFNGYHTGTDFETLPDERNIDVPIFAACDGKLLLKKSATGYGGVVVQSCKLDGVDVTIIYGHLRLSSIALNVGDNVKAGEQIAVLGTGYSMETDGERKHLHFGIHKGTLINILGYVQKQSELNGWLNAVKYLN